MNNQDIIYSHSFIHTLFTRKKDPAGFIPQGLFANWKYLQGGRTPKRSFWKDEVLEETPGQEPSRCVHSLYRWYS